MNIFESKKKDFEIKTYRIKNINDNDGHVFFDAKNKIIVDLNKEKDLKIIINKKKGNYSFVHKKNLK